MAQVSYEAFENAKNNQASNQPRVGFFALKNDKDEAVVRIMHDSPADFDIVYVHPVQINDKFRKVNCIRNPYEPMENCPFCEAQKPLNKRVYIHLIEYTKNEDGTINATPKIWERSSSYITTLKNLCDEYAPLSDNLFKIKRNGVAGSMDTTYDILYASPTVYKPEVYVKDESLTQNLKAIGTAVIDNDYNQLKNLLDTQSSSDDQARVQTQPAITTAPPIQDRQYVADTTPTQTEAFNRPRRLY